LTGLAATTGDVLWKFQTGAGADAPVATYEVDGEQYVAILAGGNQYLNTAFGDHLWAFKLGGNVPPLPAPRPPGPQPPPTTVSVSPAVMAAYVGTYQMAQGPEVTVVVEDGQLMLQVVGNPNKQPLLAMADNRFFLPPAGTIQVEFVKDAAGAVTHLLVHQTNIGTAQRANKR
jgi:hypothetical protein